MEQLLGILYNQIMQEAEDFTEVSRRMEIIIRRNAGDLAVDRAQREEAKSVMYDFLCIAQEAYFKLGFQYGVRFMAEMQPERGPKHE